jgi:hypothetical protein
MRDGLEDISVRTLILINEIAELTGEPKEVVVQRALEERHTRLTAPVDLAERKQRILNVLATSMWALMPPGALGRTISQAEEDAILGYGPERI